MLDEGLGCSGVKGKQLFLPTDRNVLVAMEEEESGSGILIPDSAKPRGAVFRVVAVGPRVAEVAVGDSVILQEGALQRVAFGESAAEALGVPGARLGLVHERHIYAVVES